LTTIGLAIHLDRRRSHKGSAPMGVQTSFHAPAGGNDFLGLRRSRNGGTEIVYDDGARQRLVWRVTGRKMGTDMGRDLAGNLGDVHLSDALRLAVASPRILSTLFDELSKRAIAIETVRA
jgi:hypothetical protein